MLTATPACSPWIRPSDIDCCPHYDKLVAEAVECGDHSALAQLTTQMEEAIDTATSFLYDATCRRFDCSMSRVWPFVDGCKCPPANGCCECAYDPIDLGLCTTIHHICELEIEGECQPLGCYRIDGGSLVRTVCDCHDVAEPWPLNCRGNKEFGPCTWSVVVQHGNPPPPMGIRAAKLLACEFFNACTGGECCIVPDNVTSVTRQGVTMRYRDSANLASKGLTGIPIVDLFVGQYACTPADFTMFTDPAEDHHMNRVVTCCDVDLRCDTDEEE